MSLMWTLMFVWCCRPLRRLVRVTTWRGAPTPPTAGQRTCTASSKASWEMWTVRPFIQQLTPAQAHQWSLVLILYMPPVACSSSHMQQIQCCYIFPVSLKSCVEITDGSQIDLKWLKKVLVFVLNISGDHGVAQQRHNSRISVKLTNPNECHLC